MAKDRRHSAYTRVQRSTHGPAWRRQWATSLYAEGARGGGSLADADVRRLLGYFTAQDHDARQAEALDPTLAEVETLRRDAVLVGRLQLATLGQLPLDEMADRFGLAAPVMALWQALDFDVEGLADATGWLIHHVVEPQQDAALAEQMRLVIALGPQGARAVLDSLEGLPIDEAQRLLHQRTLLASKLRQALEIACDTPARAQRFAEQLLKLQQREAELQWKREALAQQCVAAQQNHELALRELDRAIAADELKAAQFRWEETLLEVRLEELREQTLARLARAGRAAPAAAAAPPTRRQSFPSRATARQQQGAA